METKERYGHFVLQSEDARTSAGSFFRAVQFGAQGYERHVQLFRSEMLAPDVAQAVADGLKNGLLVQHAQVMRSFEAGRIDKTAFAAYEMLEGRSVGALMERSQAERHPFAADHALLIVSKAAAALEAAQAKRQIHGFLIPEFVHVTHDGEVSVRGFGLPPRVVRDANCVGVREARFLAPELDGTSPLDIRADIFSLGAQLFEMLSGAPLPRNQPTAKSIETAQILSPGGDGAPIPKALVSLLIQALGEDPGRRHKDAAAFRKAVDTLLFSGDYSPTTFNLAFFMHTLFRDEGDEDSARLLAERNEDYRPYLKAAAPRGESGTQESLPVALAPTPAGQSHAASAIPSVPKSTDPLRAEGPKMPVAKPETGRSGRSPLQPPPETSEDQLFSSITAQKKSFPVVPVVAGGLAVLAIAGYLLTRSGSPPSSAPASAPTMNPAETAALARVRELESRLAALEAEKVAAEQKATDEATQKVQAQAKARGKAVDPVELQKAQGEARKKAQADQEARVQAERLKIEEERRRAEETRAAEATKPFEAAPFPSPSPSATVPFVPAPPVAATPSPIATPANIPAPTSSAPPQAAASTVPVAAGTPPATGGAPLLDLSDPGVVPPQLISQARMEYPPIARAQRITGNVIVSALVDEQGNVTETRIIRGAAPNSGLNQAALDNVKRRKYKPATMNGKPGRAWVAIQIDFKL